MKNITYKAARTKKTHTIRHEQLGDDFIIEGKAAVMGEWCVQKEKNKHGGESQQHNSTLPAIDTRKCRTLI